MSIIETLSNPTMVHAAAVHLPIALGVIGVPLVYLSCIVGRENEALRWVTAGCYGALAITALIAMQSGEGAMGKVPAQLPKEIWEQIEYHEKLARVIWMLGAATAVLVALTAIRIRSLQVTMSTLAILLSLGTAVWVAIAGHHGGMLVYQHGIGTPGVQLLLAESAPQANVSIDDPPSTVDPESFAATPVEDGLEPKILPFTIEEANQVSYANDIAPLLEEVCTDCHRPRRTESELDMTTVEGMLLGGEKLGPSIIPGNPDASTLIQYVRGVLQPQMPKDEYPLMDDELRLLRMWIAAGAVDDSGA
ncbi:MAG: hypothetical protein AMXMBFR82_24820 [Candidatus Hydrogenedentota bacterium]